MKGETPEDIFSQIEGGTPNLPEKRAVTQSSARVDESVKTLEDKILSGQEIINEWRKKITQNEKAITIFCVLTGIIFSYAVNRCTGNLNIPPSVYALSVVVILSIALLLIADGSLPLVVLVRFAVSLFFGHYFFMWLVAVDGHSFRWLATDVCRYPVSVDLVMVFIAGSCAGYIGKSFEEIRAAGRG